MTFYSLLQTDDSAHTLAFLVDHLKRFRHLPYLHVFHDFRYLGRELLHLETRSQFARLGIEKRHQAMIVPRVLIIRKYRCSFVERKLIRPNIIGYRIQAVKPVLNFTLINLGLQQDMADIYLISTFSYQLEDVVSELRPYNLGDFLRVIQAERDIGKLRNPLIASAVTELSTITSRAVLRIKLG